MKDMNQSIQNILLLKSIITLLFFKEVPVHIPGYLLLQVDLQKLDLQNQ